MTSHLSSCRRLAKPSVEGLTDPVADPVADPVTDPVLKLVVVLGERSLAPSDIQNQLHLRHRPTFRENYLHAALESGFIERTIPDKPSSRLQKYRLTDKGRAWLAARKSEGKK